MGMSASQARLLSLTARLSDLEFQAQAIGNSKIRLADEGSAASRKYSEALDKKIMKVKDGNGNSEDARVTNIALYAKRQDINATDGKLRFIEDGAGKLVMSQSQATALGVNLGPPPTFTLSLDRFLARAGVSENIPRAKVTDANGNVTTGTAPDETSQAYKYYSDLYQKLSAQAGTGALTEANSRPQVTILSNEQAYSPEWLESQIQSGNIYLREFDEDKGTFEQVSWTSGDNKLSEQDDKTGIAKAEAEYNATMADIQSKDKRFDMQLKTIDTEHQAIQTEIDSVKKVISKNIERSFKIFDA